MINVHGSLLNRHSRHEKRSTLTIVCYQHDKFCLHPKYTFSFELIEHAFDILQFSMVYLRSNYCMSCSWSTFYCCRIVTFIFLVFTWNAKRRQKYRVYNHQVRATTRSLLGVISLLGRQRCVIVYIIFDAISLALSIMLVFWTLCMCFFQWFEKEGGQSRQGQRQQKNKGQTCD